MPRNTQKRNKNFFEKKEKKEKSQLVTFLRSDVGKELGFSFFFFSPPLGGACSCIERWLMAIGLLPTNTRLAAIDIYKRGQQGCCGFGTCMKGGGTLKHVVEVARVAELSCMPRITRRNRRRRTSVPLTRLPRRALATQSPSHPAMPAALLHPRPSDICPVSEWCPQHCPASCPRSPPPMARSMAPQKP